jgi:hypothetical protein
MMTSDEVDALHSSLIDYCGMDTYAMVRLLETLREQAS